MSVSKRGRSIIRASTAAMIISVILGPSVPDVISRTTGQAVSREPLQLTSIANCGVLVSTGDSKVLIDALFDKPNPEYRAPAVEVLDKIMKGAAPFDGVDLVLVTHNHPDHFDARLAVRYLETLPEPLLLAPADAVEEMRKTAADWKKIEARVVSLDIKVGQKDKRELKGISVTALRTLHSGDRESPMNLMYLFELGGRHVFHEGDSTGKPESFQSYGLGDAPVDLALVHYWFPLEPNCARFLQEVLKPDHIALTHLPVRLESDAPGKIDQVRTSYKDIFLLLPGMPSKVFQERNSSGGKRLGVPDVPAHRQEVTAQKKAAHDDDWSKLQPPEKIMDAIGLKPGMVIGEVGAGTGRFTVWLARRVGNKGLVYANDIDKSALSILERDSQKTGLTNIKIILGQTHEPCFPPRSLDMAFMINVYNAFEDPLRFLRNIAPALKPGGRLAIVLDDPAKSGGESPRSATREQFLAHVDKAGYKVEKEETFLPLNGLYVLRLK
jgi:L-ascorbate metabolism protein UlaG (beta-lactamase superfamily)/precorrin-6B methylase 2